MKLSKLLERLEYEVVQGSVETEVTTLANDSRKVESGSVFVCISGAVFDGHQYVSDVAKKGAAAIIALLTFSVLLFLIAYILINGVPHIKLSLFEWNYTSENASVE